MMMYRLRGKAFLCAQVNNKFLYVYCRYLLERVLVKVRNYVLDGIIIKRDCFRLMLPVVNTDGKPVVENKR